MKKILSTAPLLRLVLEMKLQMYTESGKFYDLNYRKCGCLVRSRIGVHNYSFIFLMARLACLEFIL